MRSASVVMLVFTAIVLAQAPAVFNPFAGFATPGSAPVQSGAWTMYRIDDTENNHSGKMKFALVGDAERGGQKCHWFEIEIWSDDGNHDIIKFLTKGDVSQGEQGYFSTIMKHNDEPAYEFEWEVPKDTTTAQQQPASEAPKTEVVEATMPVSNDQYEIKTASETITVPAGTFDATRITQIDKETKERSDVWFSSKIPLVGIAKVKSEKSNMELLSYGNDGAKSAITETPQKFSWSTYMQDQMKKSAQEDAEEKTEEGVNDAINKGIKSIFGR